MKLRIPKLKEKADLDLTRGRELRKSFLVRVVTPIYGGGVEAGVPDQQMPIRGSAIRGHLRFWWRLLHPELEGTELFQEERRLWGAMSEPGKDYSSQVRLRVREVRGIHPEPCAKYKWNNEKGQYMGTPCYLHDIPSYALFSGKGELSRDGKYEKTSPCDVLLPRPEDGKKGEPLTFVLEVTCPQTIWENEVEPSLRWWASFGGIGARTRRGLGSVVVEEIEPVTEGEAEWVGCRLIPMHKKAVDDPILAWKTAIERLEAFRQRPPLGREPGNDPRKPKKLGRSHWPEADSIRDVTMGPGVSYRHAPKHPAHPAFPRAVFGMPIVFHFIGNDEPDDCVLRPKEHDRLASPLILKAMRVADGKFVPAALCLPTNPLELDLLLDNSGDANNTNLPKDYPSGQWWPADETQAKVTADLIPAMKGRDTTDALEAFLDYFDKGK